MDAKEALEILRTGVQRDITDGFNRDSTNMALALIAVADEALSKLERIAVAVETSAHSINYYDGRPFIWTRADT